MIIEHRYVGVFARTPLELDEYRNRWDMDTAAATMGWILQLPAENEEHLVFIHVWMYDALPRPGERKLIDLCVLDFVSKGRIKK